MRVIIKFIPIIFIIIIFYIFAYDIYPKYKNLLVSVKKFNELKNREEEIKNLENFITTLKSNPNIQAILNNRKTINYWLPVKPEVDNIIFTIYNLYNSAGLTFYGADFNLSKEPTILVSQVLPVKTIKFNLKIQPSDNFLQLIDGIEKSTRLMIIKKAVIKPDESNFEVESYYLKEE